MIEDSSNNDNNDDNDDDNCSDNDDKYKVNSVAQV